jgi:hypothetical protein
MTVMKSCAPVVTNSAIGVQAQILGRKNKGPPMSESKPPSYAERAEQCEQMAVRLKDPEARRRFVELAQKWRALAKQAEDKNQDEARR